MNPNKSVFARVSNYKDFVLALDKEKSVTGSRSKRWEKRVTIERNILRHIGLNLRYTIKTHGAAVLYNIDSVQAETDDKIYQFAVADVICKNNTLKVCLYFKETINK